MKRINDKLSPAMAARDMHKRVNIHRVLITGGACSGRTTAIKTLQKELTALGIKVLVMPNTATCVMNGTAANEA